MKIIQIENDEDKKYITRTILEELPEWFGIPEAREEYIRNSAGKTFFCAEENEKDLGFSWDFCILSKQEKIRLSLQLWAS